MTAQVPVNRLGEIDPQDEMGFLLFDPSAEATQAFIEKFLTIDNEIGQIVKMKLFPQQIQMLKDETGRDVTVKGRQTRASALKLARNVRRMVTGQIWGATAIIGAQDDATTAEFRDRIRHHINNDLKNSPLKVEVESDNADELVIKGLDNKFKFVSGEQRTLSRGIAVQVAHLSEFAFWKDSALDLIGGLLPAVPSPPYGFIDIESTPRGETGAFYKYAMGAKPYNPRDPFTVHLYPWWLEPRYTVSDDFYSNADIKMSAEELKQEKLDFRPEDNELKLMQRFGLTPERIIWRRLKKEAQDRTKAPFLQEYVEDLDTCWLGQEGKFFDTPDNIDHLEFYREQRRDPVKWFDKLTYNGDEVSLYNSFAIWEYPDQNDTYVGGFDAAGGGMNEDSDWSVLYIMSVKKEKIVARLRVRCSPKVFAAMVCAIGTFYKSAVISGERSHHGADVFVEMRDLGYKNIYYHVDPLKPLKKGQVAMPGVYPTEDNRRQVLERFKTAITANVLMSCCADLSREMHGFTWQKVQNRLKAAALDIIDAHDDCIFAAAHAFFIVDKVRLRTKADERRREEEIEVVGPIGRVRRYDEGMSRKDMLWFT